MKSNHINKFIAACLFAFVFSANAIAAVTAKSYAGTWAGTYTAGQGLTGVVVVLEAVDNTRLKGRFIFFPDNSNPSVPSGHYTMGGSVNPVSGKITMKGLQWVIRPSGYIFVDLSGLIKPDLKVINGDVFLQGTQSKVGKIAIRRITALPAR
jgi:hypothetical protein